MPETRVRVSYTAHLSDGDVKAYCRYHKIADRPTRVVRDRVRATLEQLGTMGLAEQIADGAETLRFEAEEREQ